MPKLTVKQQNLAAARELFEKLPTSIYEESEACMLLKEQFRLTRDEIASVLGLSLRQAMTRLASYKLYVEQGHIPTGRFDPVVFGEAPLEAVVLDEVERRNRLAIGAETRAALNDDILLTKLTEAVASQLPAPGDLKAIEALWKSAKAVGPRGKTLDEEVAMATMSDLHLCLDVPGHNFETGIEANDRFLRKILKFTERKRQNFTVKTIHLNALGDNIQGTANYSNQRWDVDRPAQEQAKALTYVLVRDVETLLLDFDHVQVNLRRGNHGYISPNKTTLDPDIVNWETVVGYGLELAFRNNKRVTIVMDPEWYSIVDILSNKVLLTHGHAMKGAATFDGVVKILKDWQAILPPFDYAVMGHLHRAFSGPLPRVFGSPKQRGFWINGTAVMSDDFLQQMGGSPTPQWWLHYFSSKRITDEHKIDIRHD